MTNIKSHFIKPLLVFTGIVAFTFLWAGNAHSQNAESSGNQGNNRPNPSQNATEITGYYVVKPNDCFQPNFTGERNTHMLMDRNIRGGTELDVTGLDMAEIKTGRQVTVTGSLKTYAATAENQRARRVVKATSIKLAQAQPTTSESESATEGATPSSSQGATAPPQKAGAVAVTELKCLLLFANTSDYTVNAAKKAASETFLFGSGGNVSDAMFDSTYGHYRLKQGDSVILNMTNKTASGTTSEDMYYDMLYKAEALGYDVYTDSPNEYQRVFFFMPDGVTEGGSTNWTAWAWIDEIGGEWGHSVYSYNWTGKFFDGHAHECGHNFGFQHSNEGGQEYRDETCVMGLSHSSSSKNAIATLNPVKKAQLGVYDAYPGSKINLSADDTLDMYPLAISPDTQTGVRCVTFAGKDYYISYRRNVLPYGKIWSNDSAKIDKIVVYTNTDFVNNTSSLAGYINEGGTYNAGNVAIKFERYGDTGKSYATVSFDLADGNTKPVANAQSPDVAMNAPTAITLTGSDANSGDTLTYSVVTNPSNGSLSGTAPNLTYTPSNGYLGSDSFVFKVDDGKISSFATVSITVDQSTYTVSYDDNQSDGGSVPVDANNYDTDDTVTVLGNTGTLVKSGNTFVGWNTQANGNGTDRNPTSTFSMGTSNVTLYAKWTALQTYAVSYNGNGNTGGAAPSNQAKIHDTNLTLATMGSLLKEGYTFTGWNTASGGGGTSYAASGTYSTNAVLALYAQWSATSYSVTFDANGGGTPSPTSKSATYDSTYGTLATVSRTGYTLNGWFTQASGGTEVLASTTVATDSNHTLYAQWTPNDYTVTFDANGGGAPSPTSKAVTFDSAYGTLATVSRTGYAFIGWFTQASGGSQVQTSTSVTDASNHTVYAQWNANPVVNADNDETVYMTGNDVAWTPADATTSAWFDAQDSNSLWGDTGGLTPATTSVGRWDDKSGNGNHLLQSTAARKPTLISNDPLANNLPSVFSGDAVVQHLIASTQAPSVKTAYFVCYYADGAQTAVKDHPPLFSSTDGSVRLTGRGNEATLWDYIGDSKNFDNFNNSGGETYVNGSTTDVDGGTSAALPLTLWKVNSNTAHDKTWRVLGSGTSGWNNYWGGLSELIFTDGTEDLATQQKIEGYLAHQWGMTAKLPSGHSYKSAPPMKSVASATVTLAGVVTDSDDTPSVTWSDTGTGTGTGTVTFADVNDLNSDVSFSGSGTYILRLTIDDGHVQVYDDVVITVNDPTPYSIWAGGVHSEVDGNNDGIDNGLAWVLGASGISADAAALLPTLDSNTDAEFYIFNFRRSDAANADSNTTITPQYGSDLGTWTNAVHDGTNIIITPTDDGYETGVDKVEVKVKRTLVTGDRFFSRLNVLIDP